LGATAVLIGRAYIYGLAAGGERGVTRCLELLEGEMRPALNMMGIRSVDELRRVGSEALRYAGKRTGLAMQDARQPAALI
jgi:L-lactate dehydrogenase (cytochrome)